MQTFRITPRNDRINDPDWDCSIYKGSCYVTAQDGHNACMNAFQAFGIAVRKNYVTRLNPWNQSRLVDCQKVDHPGDPYLTPDRDCVVTDEWVIDIEKDPRDILTRELLDIRKRLSS